VFLPELSSFVKQWISRRSEVPSIAQEIKAAGGLAFTAIDAAWYFRNGYPHIYSILSGGMPANSGETVSVETALNHSVVWACNRVISESVGCTPAIMMQRKGASTQIANHPMRAGMQYEPNCEITSQEFRESLTTHCVLGGDAFSKIVRRSGTGVAMELDPLQPAQVEVAREKAGQKRLVYIVKTSIGEQGKTYTVERGKPQDIFHVRGIGWDGLRGMSVIAAGRQSMGTALSAERHVARFYANGGRVPYNLKLNQKFKNDQEADKFRADWERIYSEPGRAPILEPWLEYQQTGLDAVDSQMLETRQFTVPEICRWFRVSPHLVADLSRATFSNIEELGLEFVTFTLSSWFTRWEQAFRRCVLTPEEKEQGYFLTHDTSVFLKGDIVARFAAYASALQNGHLNQDEVREKEGRDPLPNGEGQNYRVQLNMQTLGAPPAADPAAALVTSRSAKKHKRRIAA